MKLIIGLGNPGRRYRGTRHNVGVEAADSLAAGRGLRIDQEDGHALVARAEIGGRRVLLARPETYMNLSGVAVRGLVRGHRIRPEDVLVIHDDLDLPPGRIRIRPRGSAGGHHGLASVLEALGTDEIARLRIGVGRPPAGVDGAEYVLRRPDPEERVALDAAVARAAQTAERWAGEGIAAAMAWGNSRGGNPAAVRGSGRAG